MTASTELRIVFRAPAGARRGFGHLTRCLALARALGVRPLVALRGGGAARDAALALGADVVARAGVRLLPTLRPDVLVIDDPVARDAERWTRAARRAGAVVVTVHDLGLGGRGADLAIDGSLPRVRSLSARRRVLQGVRFAVLDPALQTQRVCHSRRPRVLVALGGGPHRRTAAAIARCIVAAVPTAEVRVAGGFIPGHPVSGEKGVRWIGTPRGLGRELSRATVAVVGGGVSLYEAAALGVPVVTLPVVRSQWPTVRAFASHRAAIALPYQTSPRAAARKVVDLLQDAALRRRLAARSRKVVDGHGAVRAATAVLALASGDR